MSDIRCPQCATSCDPVHRFCHVCGFPISEAVSRGDDPLVGTTLPGGYVILDLLGVGGMGRVYRAEQKALGRTVAVKIIHPYLLGDESASVRFITEARAASRLNHPNIVSVFDFGKADNQLYLVMEYLRGRDLARVDYEDGPLPFKRIVDVMIQVLAGLGEAHELGIIHRDLKPENIVLEPMRKAGDFVKVVDFGLAKMREVPSSHITSPGIVCGTPDYMSPEQGRGDPIDGRSDLYTCGVLLFQLLTGRLPFEAESPTQVVLMHLTLPPPNPAAIAPNRRIPPALVNVTLKALDKDANKRYQTADQFIAALRGVFAEPEVPSPVIAMASDAGIQCRACGTMVPRSQKFCGECGERVGAPSLVPPPPASSPGKRHTLEPPRIPSAAISLVPEFPLHFIGRERDLDWLGARRFGMENSLVAVTVVGEPGVGSTRLLEEFLRANVEAGDVVVKTKPDPWGAHVGYYALRMAITRLAGLPEGGGEVSDWRGATPEARAGLMAVFGKNDHPAPPAGRRVWSKPTLGVVLPDDRRFTAAEALRWAIMRANERHRGRLVILAIDDFHVVDGASRNAIADVVAEPPMHPLLIVATHPPAFDAAWIGPSLRLAGLPVSLFMHLAGPALAFRAGATDETTMSPLYVDQALRFSLEGGTNPPLQVADLIALRIERLPPEVRRVLQAVSVLQDDKDIPVLLAKLKDAGLILQDLGSYCAAHPMIREIVLATTPVAVRKDLNARALVDREGDPLPLPIEVRAKHAYHAQNSLEALMMLEHVADRSSERGDREGAILALRQGLDLARREMFRGELDDPEKAVLIFSRKLGEVLATSGALTDADGVLREALDVAGPSGVDRAWILGALAHVAHKRDRTKDAHMFYAQAIENARAHGAADLVASLEKMHGDWAGE